MNFVGRRQGRFAAMIRQDFRNSKKQIITFVRIRLGGLMNGL